MNFQSLFGFSRLLKEYGIPSEALRFADKSMLSQIPAPSLLQYKGEFVVAENITPEAVSFACARGKRQKSLADFQKAWSGIALIAYPDAQSIEPDYAKHRFRSAIALGKKIILALSALILFLVAFLRDGLELHWWETLIVVFDLAGLYVTWQLMLKSVHIHTKSADKICGVLQEGGCDTVLEQKASTFYGIFGWSEVGLAYFSISLISLLIFPDAAGWLAVLNACCLPFSFWSIWYQKFRIKAWCTMCVTVQALLWLIFFANLAGGAFLRISGGWIPAVCLVCAYAMALFGINALSEAFKKRINQ